WTAAQRDTNLDGDSRRERIGASREAGKTIPDTRSLVQKAQQPPNRLRSAGQLATQGVAKCQLQKSANGLNAPSGTARARAARHPTPTPTVRIARCDPLRRSCSGSSTRPVQQGASLRCAAACTSTSR